MKNYFSCSGPVLSVLPTISIASYSVETSSFKSSAALMLYITIMYIGNVMVFYARVFFCVLVKVMFMYGKVKLRMVLSLTYLPTLATCTNPDQPDIYVNGGLLNKVYFTLVKQLYFEVNLVFSPRTHKCQVGAARQSTLSVLFIRLQPLIKP